MAKERFQGAGTALVTPFTGDGAVDEAALRRFVEFQIGGGVDMLLPCGTTGEAATLELEEWERVVRIVIEQAAGRVPVIPGAGSNSTAHAIDLTRRARRLGADAVLSVAPYYNKPTQGGFYEHFKAIAEVEIPVILYNVPHRTGSNLTAATTLRLADTDRIAGIKEASGDLSQISEILRHRPPGFRVLSGDDALTLPIMALGGDGVISVAANETPGLFSQLVDAALRGDFATARALHYRLSPLMRVNVIESSPIPVKAMLAMMGLMEERCRLPLTAPSEETRAALRVVAGELGLMKSKNVT